LGVNNLLWINYLSYKVFNDSSFKKEMFNDRIREVLSYVPSAIFPAIIFPAIFLDDLGYFNLKITQKF
jgi:branched-subunit amino acid transport protein